MQIKLLGDAALVICADSTPGDLPILPIQRYYNALRQNTPPGITDIVPCFHSIGIYFDMEKTTAEEVRKYILTSLEMAGVVAYSPKTVAIPVYYGGPHGPDLAAAAEALEIPGEEVIREHCGREYTVWGIGFLPGFPYVGPLSPKLLLPRKQTPAPRVAAGSVAIAGTKSGIYPVDSPGGWHVIGWTPLKMFDPNLADPCLLKPGDNVRFVPVHEDC